MSLKKYTLFLFITSALMWQACGTEEAPELLLEYGTVSDIDGNIYTTVKVGDSWWMAENLRARHFNDGTPINFISINDSNDVWANTDLPTYTIINDSIFGCLYNGAVIVSEKQIAPAGWHIPSDEEWKELEETIGMPSAERALTGWRGTEEGNALTSKYSKGWPEGIVLFGSNISGLNALPSSCRIHDGRTNLSSNTAFWWTSTIADSNLWFRHIDAREERIFRHYTYPQYGMSLRCIKD